MHCYYFVNVISQLLLYIRYKDKKMNLSLKKKVYWVNWIKDAIEQSRWVDLNVIYLLSTQMHRICTWIMITDINLQGTGWICDRLILGRVGSYLGEGWLQFTNYKLQDT